MPEGHYSEALIAKLLKDCYWADEGALIAKGVKDLNAYRRLKAKAKTLLDRAERLDPEHNAAAWKD